MWPHGDYGKMHWWQAINLDWINVDSSLKAKNWPCWACLIGKMHIKWRLRSWYRVYWWITTRASDHANFDDGWLCIRTWPLVHPYKSEVFNEVIGMRTEWDWYRPEAKFLSTLGYSAPPHRPKWRFASLLCIFYWDFIIGPYLTGSMPGSHFTFHLRAQSVTMS